MPNGADCTILMEIVAAAGVYFIEILKAKITNWPLEGSLYTCVFQNLLRGRGGQLPKCR